MVNKKLRFVCRVIMCGMIMIMAAGAGESVKASGNDIMLLTSSAATAASGLESASASLPETTVAGDLSDSDSALASGTGSVAQPLSDSGYYFVLATYGARGEDFDVTTMRPKYIASNSFVRGLRGDDEAIIIWAVGHDSEGFHNFEYCRDCSDGHTYWLYKDRDVYMFNMAYEKGYGYTGIAGQLTVEEYNHIYGMFIPDFDQSIVYELQ